jgi:hypothetical protein
MAVLEELNKQVNRLGFIDVKLLSGAAFLTGLVMAKLFPDVLTAGTGWYVLLAFACAVHPMLLLFTRDGAGGTFDRNR